MCVHWKEESVLQAGGKSLLKKEFYANMILCELLLLFFLRLPLFQRSRRDPHAILHL